MALDKQVAPVWLEYVKCAELGTVPADDITKFCSQVNSIHTMLQQALEPIAKLVEDKGDGSIQVIFFVLCILADPFESSCLHLM